MTKPKNDLCNWGRLRSAWASAQSHQSLRCPIEEALGPWLLIEHQMKALIRLHGYPGWSESLLGTQVIFAFMLWLNSPIFQTLAMSWFIESAKKYKLVGRSLEDLCDHNAAVARDLERHQVSLKVEPWHDKTNKMTCAPSKDSDQPGHSPSLMRVFALCSVGSLGSKVSSCGQQRLWSDWVDAQADLSLCWVHIILLVLSCTGSFHNFR